VEDQDQVKLDSSTLESIRTRATESLYVFALAVLRYDWLTPEIHIPLCRLLEDYETNTRLLVCIPRGWLKTTLASIAYPMWRAVRNPNIRCLLAQNTVTNAIAKLRSIDGHFKDNKLFQTLWPELMPTKDCVWRSDAMCVRRTETYPEATFEAAGIRTQVTSRHYNLINEDDTVAPDLSDLGVENLAPTKEDIDQAIGWHRLVSPLLTNPSTDQNLVIGTRWFERDLISWIQESQKNYKTYVRSCKEDAEGNPDPDGRLTYPSRFSQPVLDELEHAMGPYMYSCLYLNTPMRSSDMIFKLEWFKYYETPPRDLLVYTTVDPAGDPEQSKGAKNDYNVVASVGKSLTTGQLYLLKYDRVKCSPGSLLDILFNHVRLFRPVIVGVEAVAYQQSLIYWIKEKKKDQDISFLIEPITHGKRSKTTRILGLQPILSSGKFSIQKHMQEFVQECLSFPVGLHDDLIDAISMQIPFWALTQGPAKSKDLSALDPFSIEGAIAELRAQRKQASAEGLDLCDTLDPNLDLSDYAASSEYENALQ
jgi:phage terminase large subunit-like protein